MEQEQTKSHSELERFHYAAILKNPMYLAEGLADVLREDLMMSMPIPRTEPIPVEQVIIHRNSDISKQEYDLLQQLAHRIVWLEKKLLEREKRKPKGKY